MSSYFAPDSDPSRLAMLNRTRLTGEQDRAAGKNIISQETLDSIQSFIPQFEGAINAVNARLGERIQNTNAVNAALDTLKIYIRDSWEQARRRARRENLDPGYLRFYHLTSSGHSPTLTGRDEWLNMGRSLIEGDAAAVAAGFPAMALPSAAELQTVLDNAQTAVDSIARFDRAVDNAQKELAGLRLQADDLCLRIISELRFTLYNLEPASQRRIMRTYGARFRYRGGEPADEEQPGDDLPPEENAASAGLQETAVLEGSSPLAYDNQLNGEAVPVNGHGVPA